MRINKFYFYASFIILTLLLVGCPQEYKPIPRMSYDLETRTDSLNYEFEYNYQLLAAYYLNAKTELSNHEVYRVSKNPIENITHMYGQMDDKFTQYFPPEHYDYILEQLLYSESVIGLGLEVDSNLKVTQVYENGPAEKKGLLRGDSILMVDSNVVTSEPIFNRFINGKLNDKIELVIQRGSKKIAIEITIDHLSMPTVFLDSIDAIPLIRITGFIDSTANPDGSVVEFKNALQKTAGATATIIDLRGNPGGSIEHCVAMAGELLNAKDTIILEIATYPDTLNNVQLRDTTAYVAKTKGIGQGRYYVFLQDEESASCSEILVAGVVSSTKSPVVGTISYGKGIGQYYFTTFLYGIAGITSFQFLDRSFESYHHYGIKPDFEIKDEKEALAKAVKLAQEKTFKRTAGYGDKFVIFAKKSSDAKEKAQEKSGAFKIKHFAN